MSTDNNISPRDAQSNAQREEGHLTLERIIDLVLQDGHDTHFDVCAFCREQFEFVRTTMLHEEGDLPIGIEMDTAAYRLAAQSSISDRTGFRHRRTWYLFDNTAVLRVLEDEARNLLIGYFLTEEYAPGSFAFGFEGLANEFRPDADGTFIIGPASLSIEIMTLSVIGG